MTTFNLVSNYIGQDKSKNEDKKYSYFDTLMKSYAKATYIQICSIIIIECTYVLIFIYQLSEIFNFNNR